MTGSAFSQFFAGAFGKIFGSLGIILFESASSDPALMPTITSGAGVPDNINQPEPNGSTYYRQNGDVYRRIAGAWVLDVAPGGATSNSATGISLNAAGTGATGAGGTDPTSNSPTGVTIPANKRELITGPTAPSTAGAPGTDLTITEVTDFDRNFAAIAAQPDYSRILQCAFANGWDGGDIEITGMDADGEEQVEVVTGVAGPAIVETVNPFRWVTRVRNLGARTAGDVTIQRGAKLGIYTGGLAGNILYALNSVTGKITVTRDATGVLTGFTPNGVDNLYVSYGLTQPVTDTGHTHTGPSHTHTGPSHSHTINDAGHTHTV